MTDLVWKALADATRRRLLDELLAGPRSTGDLCALVPELSRCGVMKHLEVLVEVGLVRVRKEGRVRWNELDPAPIQAIQDRWIRRYVAARAKSGAER